MRFLLLPTRFPRPESMGQGNITVWTNWICEKTEVIMNQLDEELIARGDPDDLFNGSANGVFHPLQDNFSLPPPVQTPRKQEGTTKSDEHLWKSLRNTSELQQSHAISKKDITVGSTQAVNREISEHSPVWPDPMRTIRNLHIQQRQNHLQNKIPDRNETRDEVPEPQEPNLISFTPLRGQQNMTEERNKPKKQRSPRRRKTKNEWQLSQREFEQNQEISHISPGGQVNIFNTEEPSISYLQLPTRTVQESNKVCMKCGEAGHWKRYCRATTWCKFCTSDTHARQAWRRYANFVRDNLITSSRRTTPVQEQRRAEPLQANVPVIQHNTNISNCFPTHQLNISKLWKYHLWE